MKDVLMGLSKYLRLLYRAPLALIWTLFVHYLGVRLPRLLGRKRRCTGAIGLWGRGLAAIMGIRIHRRNTRGDWPMGDLVVANHMGFLDIPVLLTFFPAVFVIKIEMRRVLYFGGALAHQGHLFVDRADKTSTRVAQEELRRVLAQGDRIIVFPEGRASPGEKRLPFKQGSFAAAKEEGRRVELCVIDYLPDRRMLRWDVNRPTGPQLIDLLGRGRTDVSVEFFPSELVEGDPLEFADRLHDVAEQRLSTSGKRGE